MAFLIALGLTAMVLVGVWQFVRRREGRSEAVSEFLRKPLSWLLLSFGVLSIMAFFWGVFIPALGHIRIPLGSSYLELWQAGGIGSIVWFVVWGLTEKYHR